MMKWQDMNKTVCPVCGKAKTNEDTYEVCPVCGWAADYVQRLHPETNGENNISLNEAKARYSKYGTISRKKIVAMGGKL